MLLVLNSFQKSSSRTFFLAVNILDRVFAAKKDLGVKLDKHHLHLYGIVSIFIASKFEDYSPITLQQVIEDAAHLKFNQTEILQAERDILQTLNFKVNLSDGLLYDHAFE